MEPSTTRSGTQQLTKSRVAIGVHGWSDCYTRPCTLTTKLNPQPQVNPEGSGPFLFMLATLIRNKGFVDKVELIIAQSGFNTSPATQTQMWYWQLCETRTPTMEHQRGLRQKNQTSLTLFANSLLKSDYRLCSSFYCLNYLHQIAQYFKTQWGGIYTHECDDHWLVHSEGCDREPRTILYKPWLQF